MVHRISGLALACFLPLHFLALGLAIDGEARLDGFLKWTANPLVKLAETASCSCWRCICWAACACW